MSKKMECIKNLKRKLQQMQKELQKIENSQCREGYSTLQNEKVYLNKTTNFANYNSVPVEVHYNLSRSPSWKNPTFWGNNPILGKENQSPKLIKKSPNRHMKKQLSPKVCQLKEFAENNYYDNRKRQQSPLQQEHACDEKHLAPPHRFQFSFLGSQSRETPRFEKIKTYATLQRNPILHPEKQAEKGKKIVRKPSLSPISNLIQNPKSNPNIYYFGDKMSKLSPMQSNKKNLSHHIQDTLSSPYNSKICCPHRKSCKKHFSKYFKENLLSQWS